MVFRAKPGYSFKTRVAHGGRSATLSCGTTDPFTAAQVENFVKTMKARRRWDVLDVLLTKRVSLPAAYDAFEMGTLDTLLKELASPDLDPLVTEWSKTANGKYHKQVRVFIPAGAALHSANQQQEPLTRSQPTTRIERGIEWYPTGDDFQPEDCQCARCGSSVAFRDCWNCGGDGETEEEDNEDFGRPTIYFRFCEYCQGRGGSRHCMSTPDWCEAHPIPGRESIVSTALKSEAWND